MSSRVSLVVVVVFVLVVGGACGGGGTPATEVGSAPTTTIEPGATEPRDPVIVSLDVDHVAESQLAPAALEEQRARIQAALDEVVGDVGTHGALFSTLIETAQAVLAVDAEGERILSEHPLVASVSHDLAQPPDTTPSDVVPITPVGG